MSFRRKEWEIVHTPPLFYSCTLDTVSVSGPQGPAHGLRTKLPRRIDRIRGSLKVHQHSETGIKIFNDQCFTHGFESITQVIVSARQEYLAGGEGLPFLLEYVPVVSTGFAIHASVIFSLKLSLQATRLVQ